LLSSIVQVVKYEYCTTLEVNTVKSVSLDVANRQCTLYSLS